MLADDGPEPPVWIELTNTGSGAVSYLQLPNPGDPDSLTCAESVCVAILTNGAKSLGTPYVIDIDAGTLTLRHELPQGFLGAKASPSDRGLLVAIGHILPYDDIPWMGDGYWETWTITPGDTSATGCTPLDTQDPPSTFQAGPCPP